MANMTPTQGSYLAFIHKHMGQHGSAPGDSAIAAAMQVSPGSVKKMLSSLEKKGLIRRHPGPPRSIQILAPESEIPTWKDQEPTASAQRRSKQATSPPATGDSLYVVSVFLTRGPMGRKFAKKELNRVIEIRGDQTLEELHEAIYEAFDRWDEHLYEFQFGKRPLDRNNINYGLTDMDGNADYEGDVSDTTLRSLDLKPRDKFFYWFDFGDDWIHEIQVDRIEQANPTETYPRIAHRVGESPPQDDYDD